ncbi:hypothetical protein N7499_005898 [Penicillium canescens]|uniref:DUF7707 domain-containing protein n=1 Tax=Penicillium canescens TaxID=5083 RepID=A0AAD6ICS0_PENCN|nr:uncharacterized protein N7446_001671 [Penicillium canescens]KAJ5997705.1 hypothetical protein N7522_009365 [Penicillium canescens]KAJ6043471.1 hypothetical protein N7460_004826 [Penicillium canescens]KAJ6054948.1 hypothetical protein N7444_004046 [Penicillium canescens]KAJ6073894.1 hypothetical protein N7446_001671 [Penicillium canescens]KAJ6081024.1 hypothetical protein N7499_005898 [Penicillium canescens]
MRSSVAFLSALATSVLAANSTDSYTFPEGWNIGLVDSSTRSAWCTGQRNACPDICQQGTKLNSCDPATLKFSCVCSDDSSPDVSPYMQTIPFYVCENNYGQCITAHANDAEAQRACKKAASNCGSKNASEESTTSSSSTTAASTTLATATATDSSASTTSSVAAASTTTSNAAVAGDMTKMSTGLMAGLMFVAARMVL